MCKIPTPTRRDYLKATGAASVIGMTGLSGCIIGDSGTNGTATVKKIPGPIPMGSILPMTGDMNAYGSGMQKAVEIAVNDVNEAGGIRGGEISLTTKDSETNPDRALQKYTSLINNKNIVGFVGAASSVVSTTLAKNAANDGVMQVSNASTSPVLATLGYNPYRDKFFARTAPNDGQQGIVMARIMEDYIEADTMAFLHIANPYGKSITEKAELIFRGETLQIIGYEPKTQDYTSILDKLHKEEPDAIGFVGYPDSGKTILQQWAEGDYSSEATEWVLSAGLNSEEFLTNNKSRVGGMYLSMPNPQSGPGLDEFKQKIGGANPPFAPHTYDALMLQALAMQRAGEASGLAISNHIRLVSRGEGKKVTVGEFKEAATELRNGNEVNYQGASGPVDFTRKLEPLIPFAIAQVESDGLTKQLETIPRSFFQGKL